MTETQNTEQQQERTFRPAAFVGFVFMIIVLAWLAIQIVQVMPSAFSSLASLAEGVDRYKETITTGRDAVDLSVSSNTDLMNAGATIDLEWSETDMPGSYTFRYDCIDGVAVSIMETDGVTPVSCDNTYNIDNTTTLTLAVDSEKDRYQDVTYTIAFLGTNDREPRSEATGTFTVINSTIPEAGETDEVVVAPEPERPITPTEPEPPTPVAPTPTPEPEVTYTYTYDVPVSDPNGFSDLGVTITGIGRIVGDTFFTEALTKDDSGAIQFAVRNYGTKTSKDWSYEITLPDGGTYEAADQDPLKPNEAATIAIGFRTDNDDVHRFTVRIETDNDTSTVNNTARTSVSILD